MADLATLEAELVRLEALLHQFQVAMDSNRREARKALALVREAGDCLLLQNPYAARMRIQSAALVLHRVGGEN
jgi:hypothetical protein